ncbi:E22 family MetX-like putative esterase [Alteromonas lipolytica]|uniref:Probable acyltransferase n=1 Tax=Alteromonas lipolytica TaxID=1856405 RepID=A0A1E8FFF5_9ALTE|nr:homoserine O-acetyltransferase [Alteromonas lipolytica]OFI34328.1 homoserine acetyltransferase [Alteromonas lipolytica]GGF82431.1 homoserine O-acetyltransferase [Alteromonas lipolytica]
MARIVALCVALLLVLPACAANEVAPLLTTKQRFSMPAYTTVGGRTIESLQVGWESYGKLNQARDNVILITHYFSANSHAAGKYHPDDATSGYWDAIIGPGKAIDTNQYFVISVDSLANLNANDPSVITTGPSSINPDTGKPYGLDFPVVTIKDFVNVQKAVLESLGISKLHAVIGPSMGSMQALEWAASYPDWVPRMISVIGSGDSDAWTTAALEQWAIPIRLDKHWQDGDYYNSQPPVDGLAASLMLITQQALHPLYFNQQGETLNYHPLETGPLSSIRESHSIVNWLTQRARTRAQKMDANHLLYLVRACQLFLAGHGDSLQQSMRSVKAKTLFLPAENDLLLMPYMAQKAHDALLKQGKNSRYEELEGNLGHFDGVVNMQQKAELIRSFLQH